MSQIIKIIQKNSLIWMFLLFPSSMMGATITSAASGNWSASAWPNTVRTGTISTSTSSATVTGVGTLFTTEISVGNIIKTTGNVVIGTVAAVNSNTSLTLMSNALSTNSGIAYNFQGMGPGDRAQIGAGHTVTVDGNYTCDRIIFLTAASLNTNVIISETNVLTLTTSLNMPRPTTNDFTCTMNIGAGTVNVGTALVMSATTGTRTNIISITSGTLTVAGAVTTGTSACQISLTGAGTLTMGGAVGSFALSPGSSSTVRYNAAAAQTVRPVTYFNLILGGSGLKTTTGITVNGTLSVEGTATLSASPTYGSSATLRYNTSTARTVSSIEWISPFVATGGVVIDNTGTITLNASKVFNANVPLTINSGATLSTSASSFALTFNGDFINNGTLTANTSTVSFDGNTQTIGGAAETSFYNLTIAGSGLKTMDADVTVTNVLTLTGQNLAINGKTLTLAGTISGTGKLNGSATSNLVITGTGNAGTLNFANTDASTKTLNALTLNRTSSGSVTIGTDSLFIKGVLTLTNGTLNTSGKLVLLSTSTSTARVAPIVPANAAVSGALIVQRFIPGGANKRKWRFLSSPINVSGSMALSQLIDDIFVTGSGAGFDASPNNAASVRTYTESVIGSSSLGWTDPTDINNTISTGVGIEVFVRGDRFLADPFNAATVPNDVTVDYEGDLNVGDFTLNLSFTNTGNGTADGFNLVGNPYASQINWDTTGWTKTNIENKIWSYNPNTALYGIYDADLNTGTNSITPYIASGQGFFVRAIAASPVLTFTENVKAISTPNNYFRQQAVYPILRLKLVSDGTGVSDETLIVFDSLGTKFANDVHDASKFFNDALNLYSKSIDNYNLAINAHPFPTDKDTISLSVFSYDGSNVAEGTYRIDFDGLGTIDPSIKLLLVDYFTNTFTDLRSSDSYAFSITADPASVGNNRFKLLAGDINTGVNETKRNKPTILLFPNPVKSNLTVQLTNQLVDQRVDCIIYDQLGREVYEQKLLFTGRNAMVDMMNIKPGSYIIRLYNDKINEVARFIKE